MGHLLEVAAERERLLLTLSSQNHEKLSLTETEHTYLPAINIAPKAPVRICCKNLSSVHIKAGIGKITYQREEYQPVVQPNRRR